MKIAHLAIKVDDLEAAGEFYETVFGFRDVRQGQNRDHYSRHMTDGHIDIALVKYDEGAKSKEATALGNKTGIHHFGFEVDSVDEFAEQLKKRGLEVISNPGVVPLKFKAPGGGVAEVAPRKHFKID